MCIELFAKIYVIFMFVYIGVAIEDAHQEATINKPVIGGNLNTWTQLEKGSLRCFCNLPVCISTGYMCKSTSGGCFSDLSQTTRQGITYHGRHGCVELLTNTQQRYACQENPTRSQQQLRRINTQSRYPLHCCYHDMCNHADDPQTKDLFIDNSLDESEISDNKAVESQLNVGNSSADMWFKAATIVVPICGAVILFVLIALAIRLLKTESLHNTHNKLGCTYVSHDSKNNCMKHYHHPSQHLHFKEGLLTHQHLSSASDIDYREQHYVPIIVKKNAIIKSDVRNNSSQAHEYNFSSSNSLIIEVNKCQNPSRTSSSISNNGCIKSTIFDTGYSNPSTEG